MTTPESFNLNYYSKHNRARQRKNITSLYTLLPSNAIKIASPQQFCLKINVSRQNYLTRKEQSLKQLYPKQAEKNFEDLNSLHESQRQEIISYIHKSSRDNSSYNINSAQSKLSQAFSDNFNDPPKVAHQKELKSYKTAKQMLERSDLADSDEDRHIVQSFFEDEEQSPFSVVIQRIDIHPNRILPENESQIKTDEPKLKAETLRFQPLQPLEAQIETLQATLPQKQLQENTQKQNPDKHSLLQSQYDQDDFNDLVSSPIELIRRQSQQHISQSQLISAEAPSRNRGEPASLQEMLVKVNKSNQSINQDSSSFASPPAQPPKEKNIFLEREVPARNKKMNFKALMNKNKSLESEQGKADGFPFRSQRNKKLLLNFFDEN